VRKGRLGRNENTRPSVVERDVYDEEEDEAEAAAEAAAAEEEEGVFREEADH
jgi:hypothetical protein